MSKPLFFKFATFSPAFKPIEACWAKEKAARDRAHKNKLIFFISDSFLALKQKRGRN
jgi:hypothetical protein